MRMYHKMFLYGCLMLLVGTHQLNGFGDGDFAILLAATAYQPVKSYMVLKQANYLEEQERMIQERLTCDNQRKTFKILHQDKKQPVRHFALATFPLALGACVSWGRGRLASSIGCVVASALTTYAANSRQKNNQKRFDAACLATQLEKNN